MTNKVPQPKISKFALEDFYKRINAKGLRIPMPDGYEYRYNVTYKALVYSCEINGQKYKIKVKESSLDYMQEMTDDEVKRRYDQMLSNMYSKEVIKKISVESAVSNNNPHNYRQL